MSLMAKLKKNSSIKETDSLEDSKLFDNYDEVASEVPILNTVISGSIDGGLRRGLLTINGESRMFKTIQGLVYVAAYLKKHKDGACIFIDSEFGAGKAYFKTLGIDTNRVLHVPVMDVEEMMHEVIKQLDGLEKDDKVIIFIDSIGGLGSRKEAEDALADHMVADMTRAKKLKSFSRLLPVRLVMKDIPCIAINHVYQEQKLYGKTIISGGQGILLASEVALIVTRSTEKEEKDVVGYNFNITVEKSRWVKEKSKVSLQVRFDGGINRYSGILELALESGHVTKPKNGYYHRVDLETGEVFPEKPLKEENTNTEEFMRPILNDKAFKDFVSEKFRLAHGALLDDIDTSVDLSEDEEVLKETAPKKSKKA